MGFVCAGASSTNEATLPEKMSRVLYRLFDYQGPFHGLVECT